MSGTRKDPGAFRGKTLRDSEISNTQELTLTRVTVWAMSVNDQ